MPDVGQIVDKAKVVAFAGLFALLMGLAGAFALAAALAALLAQWLVWPAALAVTAVACLALAAIGLWVGVRSPSSSHAKASVEGEDQAVESAMSQLSDLPMEMAKKIISERPIAALAVFSGFGVLIARRPEIAVRLVERLITRFT
jgi:hypothetical protein